MRLIDHLATHYRTRVQRRYQARYRRMVPQQPVGQTYWYKEVAYVDIAGHLVSVPIKPGETYVLSEGAAGVLRPGVTLEFRLPEGAVGFDVLRQGVGRADY